MLMRKKDAAMTACPSGDCEAEYKKYPRAELQKYEAENERDIQFIATNAITRQLSYVHGRAKSLSQKALASRCA